MTNNPPLSAALIIQNFSFDVRTRRRGIFGGRRLFHTYAIHYGHRRSSQWKKFKRQQESDLLSAIEPCTSYFE